MKYSTLINLAPWLGIFLVVIVGMSPKVIELTPEVLSKLSKLNK